MSMVLIGSALIAGGAQFASAQQAANAQDRALGTAGAQTQAGIRAQTAATGQQLELSRPLVQTRDAALGALQTLFGLPQTAPSQIASTPGFTGTSGQSLVSLPGVRVLDQSAKKDKTQAADLLGAFTKPGRDEVSSAAYFDPARQTFVDANGAAVDASRLVHGTDNRVRVGPDGRVYSVGNRGEMDLGVTLPSAQAPAAGTAGGAQAGLPADRNALLSTLMNTPGIRFVDEQGRRELEQMMAARGLRRSGAAFEAGIQRASDLASTNYTNLVLNPLFQLAGFGQQGAAAAGGALAQQGANAAGNAATLGNLALQAGNARASSFAARGEAIGDLASNLAGIYARRTPTDTPKTGLASATLNKQQTALPATGFFANTPNGPVNDPTGLYGSIYGGN